MKNKSQTAKVYLVGAGPGDPGLLTLKALEYIKAADVILYDRLISDDILKHGKRGVLLKYVGKEKGESIDQGMINDLILFYAKEGKMVVRLKGGDSFIFGRGQEEMFFLMKNGIECEVVPGVSSFYAVPEVCGIPLTYRGVASGFMVVTGHEDPTKNKESIDWRQAAKFSGTLVIMMGLSNLKMIADKLIAYGKNSATPVAVIANGTTNKEKMVIAKLSDIVEKTRALKAPAICVIGEVVKKGFWLNPQLKPLIEKSYLLTGSDNLNRDISQQLERLGAKVECLPMIKIQPTNDTQLLDEVIRSVKNFDWLVFTSRHGVIYFLKRFGELKAKPKDLVGRIACVGSGTAAEFEKVGIDITLMPEKFTTKDLALTLVSQGIAGKKIALLRTVLPRDYLKKILVEADAKITDCIVYNVDECPDKKAVNAAVLKNLDGIFFLSPKSVKVFLANLDNKNSQKMTETPVYSIGPVTTKMLKKQGLKIVKSAQEYTVKGLVELCLKEVL